MAAIAQKLRPFGGAFLAAGACATALAVTAAMAASFREQPLLSDEQGGQLSADAIKVHETVHGWAVHVSLSVSAPPVLMGKPIELLPNYQPNYPYEGAEHLLREPLVYDWFVTGGIHRVVASAADAFESVCFHAKASETTCVALLDPDAPDWKPLAPLETIRSDRLAYAASVETIRQNAKYRLLAAAHAALGPHDPGISDDANKLVLVLCGDWAVSAEELLFKLGFAAAEEPEGMPWRKPAEVADFANEWRTLLWGGSPCEKGSKRTLMMRRTIAYADRIDVLCGFLEQTMRLSWPGGFANHDFHLGRVYVGLGKDVALAAVIEKTLAAKTGLIYAWADTNCKIDDMACATYERGRPMFPLAAFRLRVNVILLCLDGSRRGWRNGWKDATSPRPFHTLKGSCKATSQRHAFRGHKLNLPVANMCQSTIDSAFSSFQKYKIEVPVDHIHSVEWISPTVDLCRPPYYVAYNSERHGVHKIGPLLNAEEPFIKGLCACHREPDRFLKELPGFEQSPMRYLMSSDWGDFRGPRLRQMLEGSLAKALLPSIHAALGPHHPSSQIRASSDGEPDSYVPLMKNAFELGNCSNLIVESAMSCAGRVGFAKKESSIPFALGCALLVIKGAMEMFGEHMRLEWPWGGEDDAYDFIDSYSTCTVPSILKTLDPKKIGAPDRIAAAVKRCLRGVLDLFYGSFKRNGWMRFLLDLPRHSIPDLAPLIAEDLVAEVKRCGWRCSPELYTKILWARALYVAYHVIKPGECLGVDRRLLAEAQLTNEQRMITQGNNGHAVNFARFGTLWSDYPSYVGFSLSDWVATIVAGQSKQARKKLFTPQCPLPSWCSDIAHHVEEVMEGIEREWELEMSGTTSLNVTTQDQFAWQQTRRRECWVKSKGGIVNTIFDGLPVTTLEIMRALANSEQVWKLTQRKVLSATSGAETASSAFSPLGKAMLCLFDDKGHQELIACLMAPQTAGSETQNLPIRCTVMLDDITRIFRTCSDEEPIRSLLHLHEQWERIWRAHKWNGAYHAWDIGYNSSMSTVLPSIWLLAREYARRESCPPDVKTQLPYVSQDSEYPASAGAHVWPKKFQFTREAVHDDEPELGPLAPGTQRMRRCCVLHVWYFIHMLKRIFASGGFSSTTMSAEIAAQRIGLAHSLSSVGVLRDRVLNELLETVAPTDDKYTAMDVKGSAQKLGALRMGFLSWLKVRAQRRAALAFYASLAEALPKFKDIAYTKV